MFSGVVGGMIENNTNTTRLLQVCKLMRSRSSYKKCVCSKVIAMIALNVECVFGKSYKTVCVCVCVTVTVCVHASVCVWCALFISCRVKIQILYCLFEYLFY